MSDAARNFDVCVRENRGRWLRAARTIVGRADLAEDAVQVGLLNAFRALPNLRDPDRLEFFVEACMRREAIRLSQLERNRATEELSENVTAPPDDLDLAEELRTCIEAYFATRPEQFNTVEAWVDWLVEACPPDVVPDTWNTRRRRSKDDIWMCLKSREKTL